MTEMKTDTITRKLVGIALTVGLCSLTYTLTPLPVQASDGTGGVDVGVTDGNSGPDVGPADGGSSTDGSGDNTNDPNLTDPNTTDPNVTAPSVTDPSATDPNITDPNGSNVDDTQMAETAMPTAAIAGAAVKLKPSISGHISSPLGPATNVPVLLVDQQNLPALAAVLADPALLKSGTNLISQTRTNSKGDYTFSVLVSSYLVVPFAPGSYFSPAYRTVAVKAGDKAKLDFTAAGVDTVAPKVTMTSATTAAANGSASDQTSGVLTVVLTLQNASHAYFNWANSSDAPQFTATPLLGSFKLAITPPNPNKVVTAPWQVTLPDDLAPGTYLLTARAVDRALKVSDPVSRTITVVASRVTLSNATANATTNTIDLTFSGALEASDATDATVFTVQVGSHSVAVQSASYDAKTHTVHLMLATGALRKGAVANVHWNDLKDSGGHVIMVQPGPITVR
ncbi:MAG: hypothetical protein JOZ57_01640 [Abitibacteriaceae bacterium]|nr:hypothetical protein [Abditibacteriaceae bacterium]